MVQEGCITEMKKGNVMIEVVLSLIALSIGAMLLYNMASLKVNLNAERKIEEMSKYWNNLERFKIYLPIEKPVDITY